MPPKLLPPLMTAVAGNVDVPLYVPPASIASSVGATGSAIVSGIEAVLL